MNDTKKEKRDKGRPKSFCREQALDGAVKAFCIHGYDGTSMAEISKAMGMNPPSIYGAFGDKEALFIEVLDHYHAPHTVAIKEIFNRPITTLEALKLLFEVSKSLHSKPNALGCLVVNSVIQNTDTQNAISSKLKELQKSNENLIYDRLNQGKKDGDIPEHVHPRKLARYINAILQGIASSARGLQSAQTVSDIADQALEALELTLQKTH